MRATAGRRRGTLLGAALSLFLVSAALAAAQPAPSLPASAGAEDKRAAENVAVFDQAWRVVRDNFYDPKLHGVDWKAVGDRCRPLAAAAQTPQERSTVINAMLGELRASHTHHYTQADPAYYELLDIFARALEKDLKRLFPGGEVAYEGIGITTRMIGDKTFVAGVIEGLPASRAGLLVGDEILDADGKTFAPIASFTGKRGQSVWLRIRRDAGAAPQTIAVIPERIEPAEAFLHSEKQSARIIEAGGKRIGYIRIWSYASPDYQEALEEQLTSGKLKDADALIWDLRDGWGGAQPEYLDLFSREGVPLNVTGRDGRPHVANPRWRKPVALLINGGTRSGKEILAYGFRAMTRGPLVGTRTAGAVLAARAFLLQDDSLLLLAVSDVDIEGTRLEGVGVAPTEDVPFPLEYAAGRDPQLDRAVELLSGAATN